LTFVDVVEKTLGDVLKPRDCSEIYNFGRRSSGVYTVYSGRTARRTEVYCDMWTDGGGWTVCIAFCSLALLLDPTVGHTMDVLSPFISVLCHSD